MDSRKQIKFLILVSLSVALLSCETVSYYTQAARGQLSIVMGREKIERLLEDDSLSDEMRGKFELVLELREFAAAELLLPVDDNYASYVDVQREHVVWNVFAAPEFSTDNVNWCYPIAGCVTYRGYFSESGAARYAERLGDRGFDVYTGGVDAYSTLGWFEDSLLSTVIDRVDYQLAGLIFHELAHQVVYLPGDTTFNESFATAVEREGVRRWLDARGQQGLQQEALLNSERQEGFVAMVSEWRDRFDALYQQEMQAEQMRLRKQALQQGLRDAYQELKQSWGGYSGYDNWFSQSLNNAQLSTVSSYNDLVPAFDSLLAQNGGELSPFYAAVAELAARDEDAREQAINLLLAD